MTVDTSRPAVEALIAALDVQIAGDKLSHRAARALAALLDERDRWQKATERVSTTRDLYFERIRELEAERDNAIPLYEKDIRTLARRAERAEEQLQAIREVVTGWNGFAGLTREVLAILDINEPKGDDDDH